MLLSRRAFGLGAVSMSLFGCSNPIVATGRGASAAPAPEIEVQRGPAFDAWVAAFRPKALSQGISGATYDRAFGDAGFLPGVIERDRNQFQVRRTVEDYIALAASDDRISEGQAKQRQHAAVLSAIEARYSIPSSVLVALWGVESRYGTRTGTWPVISSLATLVIDGRRGAFFEGQLIAALKMLERGEARLSDMQGSWAGAMGHTQLIPGTYEAYAVDFNGDGRRDIWGADPGDALASTASYLRRFNWRAGQSWGVEVTVPEGVTPARRSRDSQRQSVSAWANAGVRRMGGGALPPLGSAGLIRPGGAVGPVLLVGDNFRSILRYNASDSYALALGHLSDRLRGAGPFRARFGPDANGLTLEDRKSLQRRLAARGYEFGTIDGVIGRQTEAAIRAYQTSQGLEPTGQPSQALLRRLRG